MDNVSPTLPNETSAAADALGLERDGAKPAAVSLFTGAMGLDLGLEKAGFQIRAAVEANRVAAQTIRLNRPDTPVIERRIEDVTTAELMDAAGLKPGKFKLLAGGPACQAFSTAGKRRSLADPIGRLFYEFMRVVDEARPEFFVIENVRGLLSAAAKHRPLAERGAGFPPLGPDEELGSAFERVTDRLEQSGYYVVFDVLNSADFGSAQHRQRLVLLGSRDGAALSMPKRSHQDRTAGLPPWRTLRDAVEGLREDEPEYLDFVPSRRKFFADVPPGGNWRDLPEPDRTEAMGGALTSWGGRSGFFRRLSWDRPTPTLNSNPDYKATAICHPEETRPLSVREYARVQGFDDDWTFDGSTRDKYRQIGNAVPVELATALGESVVAASAERRSVRRLGKVECLNLTLLNSLHARPRTRLNPPRMRGDVPADRDDPWSDGRTHTRDDASRYTPGHLLGAVGKTKRAATMTERLREAYGSPDLGNYQDPVDELFFIVLSQRTTEPSYTRVFKDFKRWTGGWDTLPDTHGPQVAEVIADAGLGRQKARHIVAIAEALQEAFGAVTLGPLTELPDDEVQAFLTSLPGVGVKTAKCVMLFSMGRQVLPVDAHVERVATRAGLVEPATSKQRTHEVLEAVVPSALRRDFHVNAIAHGRAVCRARDPDCGACVIRSVCAHRANSRPRPASPPPLPSPGRTAGSRTTRASHSRPTPAP